MQYFSFSEAEEFKENCVYCVSRIGTMDCISKSILDLIDFQTWREEQPVQYFIFRNENSKVFLTLSPMGGADSAPPFGIRKFLQIPLNNYAPIVVDFS